jgi:endonuclease G, mitochondrial
MNHCINTASKGILIILIIGCLFHSCTTDIEVKIIQDPTSFEAVEITNNSVSLNWSPVEGANYYTISRNSIELFNGKALNFKDIGLNRKTNYTYQIRTFGGKNTSPSSTKYVNIKTNPNIPEKVEGLRISYTSIDLISVTWNITEDAEKYKLFRNDSLVYNGNATSYQDNSLKENTKYRYTVLATNITGSSLISNEMLANTDKKPIVQIPSEQQIDNTTTIIGMPTPANLNDPNNYLLEKKQFTLSYNNSKKHANWASWTLNKGWLGFVSRTNKFAIDNTLPSFIYKVKPTEYVNSGFDRGHLCPSADRTNATENNEATFLMTNMAPEAPSINRGTLADFEEYCREVISNGYEALIVTGTIGTGGTGTNGFAKTISEGINVPEFIYKIVVFTPNIIKIDSKPISTTILFPNKQSEHIDKSWPSYITTAKAVESKAGITLFKNIEITTQNFIKEYQYNYLENPFKIDLFLKFYNGRKLYIGPKGGCYYINDINNKTYVDRDICK